MTDGHIIEEATGVFKGHFCNFVWFYPGISFGYGGVPNAQIGKKKRPVLLLWDLPSLCSAMPGTFVNYPELTLIMFRAIIQTE
jgi:hypothetical protein